MNDIRAQFMIDPSVVFLNHGSFGACPKPVFEAYQRWQRELEYQPVEFLGRRVEGLLDAARARLAEYLNGDVENLVFVPNATSGVNIAARSIPLQPGDEILTTEYEYGACIYAWEHVCRCGAKVVKQPITLPLTTLDAFVEEFWQGVTPRTKVIYLSHIAAPLALIFPIEPIIKRAREAGIITVIDGAHAPGQIPLDMKAIGADFYTGNCHKWMNTPKGSAFLYVRPEHHYPLEPLIISWGWVEGATFAMRNQMQGTRDPSAYLTVPDGIDWMHAHDWDSVRLRCHELAVSIRDQIRGVTEIDHLAPDHFFSQMFTALLPPCDAPAIKAKLYDDYRVEVPLWEVNGQQYIRVSIQVYNTPEDGAALVRALEALL